MNKKHSRDEKNIVDDDNPTKRLKFEPFLIQEIKQDGLYVILVQLLEVKKANTLFDIIVDDAKWNAKDKQVILTKNGRSSFQYGQKGLTYTAGYKNAKVRQCNDWSEIPWIQDLLPRVKTAVKQYANVSMPIAYLVGQLYPNLSIGIPAHRDREADGPIVGLSLGYERKLRMQRGEKQIDLALPSGSLYMLLPPTNDKWSHSIVKEEVNGKLPQSINPFALSKKGGASATDLKKIALHFARLSLTFRNAPKPTALPTALPTA